MPLFWYKVVMLVQYVAFNFFGHRLALGHRLAMAMT